jgi:peptide-methionine (S)-S-oxide reductase
MKKITAILLAMFAISCQGAPDANPKALAKVTDEVKKGDIKKDDAKMETAIFAGGCFWCTEAFFTDLKGVEKVVSGYIGGTVANPTYRQVSSGTTGHAEAIEITYNPNEVAYEDLLEIFFATHDPTTLNRQGMMRVRNIGVRYSITVPRRKRLQKILLNCLLTKTFLKVKK